MIYNLIETATGRNHSQTTVPILAPMAGFHVVETADNVGAWNEQTLQFDPYPINKKSQKAAFFKRVGISLFGKVVIASKNDIEIEILLGYINGLDIVDFDDPEFVYALELLVTKGIWTEEEKDGVLNV